jgi:MSHA biogenesis protein MshE
VIAQRLVRVVCESCAADYELLPHEREWLRHELKDADHHRCKRGKGCSRCNGTGFLGRTGVYEMLEMTNPVVEAANHEDIHQFVRSAREQMAGRTLSRHAAQIAAAGRTTVQEAMRVSNQSED